MNYVVREKRFKQGCEPCPSRIFRNYESECVFSSFENFLAKYLKKRNRKICSYIVSKQMFSTNLILDEVSSLSWPKINVLEFLS